MKKVIENEENKERLVEVRKEEILVEKIIEELIIEDIIVILENEEERFVKGESIGVLMCEEEVEKGSKVRKEREKMEGSKDNECVNMKGWKVGILRMGDERNED